MDEIPGKSECVPTFRAGRVYRYDRCGRVPRPPLEATGVGIIAEGPDLQVISSFHAPVGRHRRVKMAGDTPHPRPLSHWERGDRDLIRGRGEGLFSEQGVKRPRNLRFLSSTTFRLGMTPFFMLGCIRERRNLPTPSPLRKGGYRRVGPCFSSNLPFIPSFLRRETGLPGVRENLTGNR